MIVRSALILFPLLAFSAYAAHAAPLTGRVTDTRGVPVSGAVVGDWLKGGPFAVTGTDGRYSLEMTGAQRVVGAWKPGSALSGPRWIDARARAASADFTLFASGPDILKGRTPDFTDVAGRQRAMLDSTGVQATLWRASPSATPSKESPARITWTLNDATVNQVDVRWREAPAAWRLEMSFMVTDEDGAHPRLETRTYYRNGEDPAHDNGNGWTDARRVTTAVVKTAPVIGVKSIALVIESPGAVYEVSAFSPRAATLGDAATAMRIGLGLQDPPTDPNAFFLYNAWNGDHGRDPVINARDAVALIHDRSREVKPLRVLTINYEPIIDTREGKRLLRQVTGWNDPHHNTDEHAKDMQLASHGYLRIKRLPEIEAREYPVLFNRKDVSRLEFTNDTFLQAWRYGQWPNSDWGCDYNDIIRRYDLDRRVSAGDVDEVWIQGFPGLSMWETTMAGPNAYWCNSSPVPSPKDSLNGTNGTRLFVMTAFNYEREADVMIHDWGHRTESILGEKVYGTWNMNEGATEPKTTWDRFTRIAKFFPGKASVGYCHYPANGDHDYDYSNPKLVSSDADDWLSYPHFTGRRKMVNRDTWGLPRTLNNGTPDYQRNYLLWMFRHVPHIPGLGPDGKLANWWKYIADMNAHVESR